MKSLVWVLIAMLYGLNTYGQKPTIDTSVYDNWPAIRNAKISNDGKYVCYWIDNQCDNNIALILSSTTGSWKIKMTGVSKNFYFTRDSRKAIFHMNGDSLGIISLGKAGVEYVPFVKSFRVSQKGASDWLAYQLSTAGSKIVLQNVQTRESHVFNGVLDYLFSEDGNYLLMQKEKEEGAYPRRSLQLINLLNGKTKDIWQGEKCGNFTFDRTGRQIAFLVEVGNNILKKYEIWRYSTGMEEASPFVSDTSMGIRKGRLIANTRLNFSDDGSKLYFYLRKDFRTDSLQRKVEGVNIWNYKDKELQWEQLSPFQFYFKHQEESLAELSDKKIINLNEEKENIVFSGKKSNNYVLIYEDQYNDSYYNKEDRPSLYLESLRNGERSLIKRRFYYYSTRPILSPNEKFVVWFDVDSLSYFSYEIATGKERNISRSVSYALYDEEAANLGRKMPFGICGWSLEDREIFLYDQYDIWKVDPAGNRAPVNITHSIGRKQHTVFGLINTGEINLKGIIDSATDLLLDGYNRDTKENGFWVQKSQFQANPEKRVMDDHTYWIERVGLLGYIGVYPGTKPIKALSKPIYLVTRMNASESPNLFITNDFISFKAISDNYPEKNYNWVRSELIQWTMTDGKLSQGILYKPENFDSTKKYPIIFDYYDKRSDELNGYLNPDFNFDRINIPSYVSNGYLIFVPDIYYTPGHVGECVLNSVVSAARYLSSFSWVDSTKLGLQGHSFGGWETNYLITHSHLFAAACEAAGVSDQVSGYGQIDWEHGFSRQSLYEIGSQGSPYGVGITPWTRPELYIENSPIFKIGDITTPLLMMHNREDDAVPFEQAIELFTGMNRAGKKVWLLEYDRGGHSLPRGNNAKDYTIRMRQFFDYYLKGGPPPLWMTRGVPAKFKGIWTGLEVDESGQVP